MPTRDDIREAIVFYDAHGWDWTNVVAFLAMQASGWWPLPKGWVYRRPRNQWAGADAPKE